MRKAIRRTGIAALATATLGLTAPTADARTRDYGSGTLGDWTTYSERNYGNPSQADVWVVGDSITGQGYLELVERLTARGLTTAVNYRGSRPTVGAVDWVLGQLELGRSPDYLLMTSGSNDIFDPPAMGPQIKRLKAALPATTKLIWVDVQVSRIKYSYSVQIADQRNSMWVNNQIREQIPAAQVCAWSWWFASSPSRLSMYLGGDGVHLVDDRAKEFWGAAVSACVK